MSLTLEAELCSTGGRAHAVGGHTGELPRMLHLAAFDLQHSRVVVEQHEEVVSLTQSFTVFEPRHFDGRRASNSALEPDWLTFCLLQAADFLGEGRWRFGICN